MDAFKGMKQSEAYYSLTNSEAKDRFSKIMIESAKKEGTSTPQYWEMLVNKQVKNPEIEQLLKDNSGTVPEWAKQKKEEAKQEEEKKTDKQEYSEADKEEGMELFRHFVEGGSMDIHELAGYGMYGGEWREEDVNEEKMRQLDSVFTPTEEELHVYKGQPMTEEQIQDIMEHGGFFNYSLSSTSTDWHTAVDYMRNADEDFGTKPVYMEITVEKGVPVADVQELLGTGGMKAYEKEITIGRNVQWEVTDTKVVNRGEEDEYLQFSVRLQKKDENTIASGGQSDTIKEGTSEPLSIRYVNNQEQFYVNTGKIKPIDGYEDIVCHGDKYGFTFKDMDGKESTVSVKEMAAMLKENPEYHGGSIRLISCEAGADGSVVAQGLADEMGVKVLAPSDVLWVHENGTMGIGAEPNDNTGEWREFDPRR